MFCDCTGLDAHGLHDIPVLLIQVFWPVLMDHLKGGTREVMA